MNVMKSLIVAMILLSLIALTIYNLVRCIQEKLKKDLTWHMTLRLTGLAVVTFLAIAMAGDYVYPFERTLSPVLIAEYDVPEQYELDYPGEQFWHGAYEAYGLYAESVWFDPASVLEETKYGFMWPPMDFKHYSYIITYGQQIDQLSYNVWETIDAPIRTGAKVGHMKLKEDFSPEKIYVYRIPKMRIDNDVNDPNNHWD